MIRDGRRRPSFLYSRDRILAEIRALLKLQKEVPVVNLDGDDNLAAIDAQIDTLMDDTELEDLELQYDGEPYLLEAAKQARQWLDGKFMDGEDEMISLADSWAVEVQP
jgi:hypothetical protein